MLEPAHRSGSETVLIHGYFSLFLDQISVFSDPLPSKLSQGLSAMIIFSQALSIATPGLFGQVDDRGHFKYVVQKVFPPKTFYFVSGLGIIYDYKVRFRPEIADEIHSRYRLLFLSVSVFLVVACRAV